MCYNRGMGRNITKQRSDKMQRELTKLKDSSRKTLLDAQEYYGSAKGGRCSALIPIVRALKDSQEALREAEKALEALKKREGWL